MAAWTASNRVNSLVVDIAGIQQIASFAVLKSLVSDSWILASNTLAPLAKRADPQVAVVRALIMLTVKRLLGIKQLGPVREVLTLLSFVKVAAAFMQQFGYTQELAQTLNEISAIPTLIYTALARVLVDRSSMVLSWLNSEEVSNALTNMRTLDLSVRTRGRFGKNGAKLKADWERTLAENPDLRATVTGRGAAAFRRWLSSREDRMNETSFHLNEWARNVA